MNKQVKCLRCDTVNEFHIEYSGPHIKAICDNCGRYIKFLKQTGSAQTSHNMSTFYNGSICLTDIPKDKITTSEKNGKKYLNINVWVNDEQDQFGNIAGVSVSQTKEEREAKVKRVYIGNLKAPQGAPAQTQAAAPATAAAIPNDLPF